MAAPLSSVEWNTIYGNCWKQRRAAEADERHVMQWKHAKPSRNLIFIYHFFFLPSNVLLCCFWLWGNGGGGGEGSIKWFRETAAGYNCGPGAPTLDKNRSAPRWQHILHAGTPLQSPYASANLRKGENFIPPTHEYPWGQSLYAQAAEKTRRPMSERCCSEDSPPSISSTPPVHSVPFTVWNSFVFLWIVMLDWIVPLISLEMIDVPFFSFVSSVTALQILKRLIQSLRVCFAGHTGAETLRSPVLYIWAWTVFRLINLFTSSCVANAAHFN